MYQYANVVSRQRNASKRLIMAVKNIMTANRKPRLRTSCKKISKHCCSLERETAWPKFRKQNKKFCKNFNA